MPGRIALIVRELSNVHELQRGLTKLHDRVDALSWHVSALQEQQEKVLTLVERTAQQAATASRVGESGPASGATKPSPLRYERAVTSVIGFAYTAGVAWSPIRTS